MRISLILGLAIVSALVFSAAAIANNGV